MLQVLLVAAVLESLVHYTDNTLRYDDYTVADPSILGGLVKRWVIPTSWVLFTVAAVLGYRAFREGRRVEAAAWLGAYSVSGLISVLHYTDISVDDLSAFQNTFVFADVVLGVLVLAFALWLALRAPTAAPLSRPAGPVARDGAGRAPASLLQLRLVHVAPAGEELVAHLLLDGGDGAVVGVVELLDHLVGPPAVEHVAPDDLGVHEIRQPAVAGGGELVGGVAEQEVGAAEQLVEGVEVASGPLQALESLTQRPAGLDRGVVDALAAGPTGRPRGGAGSSRGRALHVAPPRAGLGALLLDEGLEALEVPGRPPTHEAQRVAHLSRGCRRDRSRVGA